MGVGIVGVVILLTSMAISSELGRKIVGGIILAAFLLFCVLV